MSLKVEVNSFATVDNFSLLSWLMILAVYFCMILGVCHVKKRKRWLTKNKYWYNESEGRSRFQEAHLFRWAFSWYIIHYCFASVSFSFFIRDPPTTKWTNTLSVSISVDKTVGVAVAAGVLLSRNSTEWMSESPKTCTVLDVVDVGVRNSPRLMRPWWSVWDRLQQSVYQCDHPWLVRGLFARLVADWCSQRVLLVRLGPWVSSSLSLCRRNCCQLGTFIVLIVTIFDSTIKFSVLFLLLATVNASEYKGIVLPMPVHSSVHHHRQISQAIL